MKKVCTYGLPDSEVKTLSEIYKMVSGMSEEDREKILQACNAVRIVNELKNIALPA